MWQTLFIALQKAFINTFSDILQREVKEFGIVVQSLNPGRTKTDFQNTEAFKNVEKINANIKEMSPEVVVDTSFKELGKKVIYFTSGAFAFNAWVIFALDWVI